MLDPWTYATKYPTEHGEQTALFMFTNMAANFGLTAANDVEAYSIKGNALANLDRYDDRIPQLKYLFAIHNQGHGDAIRGQRAKAEGLKVGVPDLCLPVSIVTESSIFKFNSQPLDIYVDHDCYFGFAGLYIELKRKPLMKPGQRKAEVIGRSAGKASDKQIEWQTFLREQGYVCEVCYGWEEARDLILKYLKKEV